MHRSSVSTILRLKDVKFDRVCVFENSFYSLSRKHMLVLISSCFLKVVLMSGARFIPIVCGALLLTSCSEKGWLEGLEAQTGVLFQSSSSPAGDFAANEDEAYSLQLEVQDVDIPYGDKLSFSMVALPLGCQLCLNYRTKYFLRKRLFGSLLETQCRGELWHITQEVYITLT